MAAAVPLALLAVFASSGAFASRCLHQSSPPPPPSNYNSSNGSTNSSSSSASNGSSSPVGGIHELFSPESTYGGKTPTCARPCLLQIPCHRKFATELTAGGTTCGACMSHRPINSIFRCSVDSARAGEWPNREQESRPNTPDSWMTGRATFAYNNDGEAPVSPPRLVRPIVGASIAATCIGCQAALQRGHFLRTT
jgi:hypothetical protein